MKILKCLTLLMILFIGFGTQAIAQEKEDKKVKKKIVVIKKEVDENGKVTEEKIVKEGKEAEAYMEEMDIEVITKEKDGNITVTVETDEDGKKKKKRKGKNEDVEVRVEVRANGDGEEVEIRKEIEEIKIKLKEGKDGEVKIMEFDSWDDVPDDVKKKLKDMSIEVEKGGHGAKKVEKRVIIRGGDGDEEEEIIINGDGGEHKVLRLNGSHDGKHKVIIRKGDGEEDVEIIELDGAGFSGDMMKELHVYGMGDDHIMKMTGDPNRGYLGVKIQDEDEGKGVIIKEVYEKSAAGEAGLQKIDIITAVGGKKVVTVEDLIAVLKDKKPGDKVKVDYLRKGTAKSTTVALKKQQKNVWFSEGGDNHFIHKDANVFFSNKKGAFLGVSPGDDKSDKGFKIAKVTKESGAEKAGLKAGDIITKIGDKAIKSFDDVADKIGNMKPEDKVKIAFIREGKSKEVEVTLGKHKNSNVFEWNGEDGNSFFFDDEDHDFFVEKAGASRPMLGVLISDEDSDKGVKLSGVTDESGAAKAGLKKGDVLTKVAGQSVSSVKAIHDALDGKKAGDKVKVSYLRDGKENNAEITLGASKNVMLFKTDGKDKMKKKKKIIVIEKEEKKEKE